MITKRHFVSLVSAIGIGAVTQIPRSARSQAARNTGRLLVGFTPGGTVDVIARLLVTGMKNYSASLIVDNRPGGGGRIALDALKSSAADGSVMIFTPAAMVVLYPHVYKALSYDPFQDFVPVTVVCSSPYLLTVGPRVPAEVKTIASFISWCKANLGQANYGTGGSGTMMHFTGVTLGRAAGFEFVHVPYPGPGGVQDLLAGQIAATVYPIGNTIAHVRAGSLRALATTGPQRNPLLPDVPTVSEAGYPQLEAVEWFGIFLPAKTPADIVNKLNSAIIEVLRTDEFRTGLATLSVDVANVSSADFARLIKSDFDRWGAIAQASGFTAKD
jgi:tripartite-type tricarboxylate transporter receptor subunit TctC